MTPHYHTPFSALTRRQSTVLAEVEVRDVLLERRDGPNLMLVAAERELDMREAVGTIAQLVALLPADALDGLSEQLAGGSPWVRALPAEDRVTFVREVVEQAQRCADLGDFAGLGQLVHEWRNTALVHDNPSLLARLQAASDLDEPVERPAA